MAAGGFPYLNLWDIKPPGLFLLYALPGSLPVSGGWPVMALDLAVLGLSLLLMDIWLARLAPGPAGQAAGLLLTFLWLFSGDYWDVGQAERLAIPLLLGLFLALAGRSPRRWAAAGTCLGLLPLLKTSLLFLAPAALPWMRPSEPRRPRSSMLLLAMLAAGALLPLLMVAAWLAWGGALSEAVFATISFTSHYTRLAWAQPRLLLRTAAGTSLSFFEATWGIWLLAFWGTLAAGKDAGRRRLIASMWIALAGGAFSILAQGKFFPYHWIVLWVPLVVLAGLGAAGLAARMGAAWGLKPALAALLPVALAVVLSIPHGLPGWRGWAQSARRLAGRIDQPLQLAAFRVQGMGYDELQKAAQRAAASTPAGSPLYLWGFEPAF
ncbi:MAG: hypothetical protein ACE5ID_12675, partial [Acidobacteriota bacterium]